MTPVLAGFPFPNEMEPQRVKTLHWTNPKGMTWDDWLQAIMKKQGYITMFGSPTSNLFNGAAWWDQSGFVHVPPVYVGYSNYRHAYIKASQQQGYCLQGKMCHQHMFDYTKQMWDIYWDVPKMCYIHFHEGHDLQQTAGVMDNEIPGYIDDIMSDNNTIVFFMSDHGAGPIHNRPFLNIIVPIWWMEENRLEEILYGNQEQLFSGYDLHKTLKHAISMPNLPEVPAAWANYYPSISLFEKLLPVNRTCLVARIPPNHCFCEPWREPSEIRKKLTDPSYNWLVDVMMDAINTEPGIQQKLCPEFTMDTIDMIAWKEPKEETGVRYWMIELTMKEGNPPNRYVMSLQELIGNTNGFNILSLKQITRYFKYEKCTPRGASPEFCVCKDDG